LIRCFFSENDPLAYSQLKIAVSEFHRPDDRFEIRTYCGNFVDAVGEIEGFIGNSFPLIFIDPTGWSGYPFDQIKPLFVRRKCEVLINFMYDFVNRFASSDDPEIVASLNPILGGEGWRDRLNPNLPLGLAVEELFRGSLKLAVGFDFVVSTRIDKATSDRPHFFLACGTKSAAGLKAFRETEYFALREHAKNRAGARVRQKEERTGTVDFFAEHHANVQESTIDDLVEEAKAAATIELLTLLSEHKVLPFNWIVSRFLQSHMLRETNLKDVCVDLARRRIIENTWGSGNRKPSESTVIRLIDGSKQ
jgi:hypothetical protein